MVFCKKRFFFNITVGVHIVSTRETYVFPLGFLTQESLQEARTLNKTTSNHSIKVTYYTNIYKGLFGSLFEISLLF